MREYKYLGNFAACEPWAAQGMSCDDCEVSWTGCWDNFQCPKCGKGELPNCDFPDAVGTEGKTLALIQGGSSRHSSHHQQGE